MIVYGILVDVMDGVELGLTFKIDWLNLILLMWSGVRKDSSYLGVL
jgi:hypothetical protein